MTYFYIFVFGMLLGCGALSPFYKDYLGLIFGGVIVALFFTLAVRVEYLLANILSNLTKDKK